MIKASIFTHILIIVASAFLPSYGRAATTANSSAKPVLVVVPLKKAFSAIKSMFDARDTLDACSFVALCHIDKMNDTGIAYPYTVEVSGTLKRPNKFYLEMRHQNQLLGKVVNDGTTETFYDTRSNRYAQCPSPSSYDVTSSIDQAQRRLDQMTAQEKSDQPLHYQPSDEEAAAARQNDAELAAVGVFYSRSNDPFASQTVEVAPGLLPAYFLIRKTSKGEIQDLGNYVGVEKYGRKGGATNMPAIEVLEMVQTQTIAPIIPTDKFKHVIVTKAHFEWDAATGFPRVYRTDISTGAEGRMPPIDSKTADFVYTKIDRITSALPDGNFTWTPPDGATLFIPK